MNEWQPNRDPLSELRREQSERWQQGDRILAESLMMRESVLFSDGKLLIDFVFAEFCLRKDLGDSPSVDDYVRRFPQLASQLRPLLEGYNPADRRPASKPAASDSTPDPGMASDDSTAQSQSAASIPLPQQIGRYRINKVLGQGGFGIVFLARDEQLNRSVAVKVPHADRVAHPEEAELYLAEARTVAGLEHPHIVPVYDVGSSAEFPFFVVSKYVDGTDLATELKHSRLSRQEAAKLVATVAEVLHYAHKQGLVHRDVKPGNILIDSSGMPHVVDFGLALREENVGKGPQYAGTPAYMSPEQACGEGHRVDGRSDIFSLGVVFYELLVGRPPFRGVSAMQMLEQIATQEPLPPREVDDTIPKELERICLKALSKRATERYATAQDLADDLRHFLNEQPGSAGQSPVPSLACLGKLSNVAEPSSDSGTIKIVPKGLRSFDAQDADFFLELLPGPRDRDGLPRSIRFWKGRIEETEPDMTFAVGLIYGPSGCGKSSLVKAGLLPRLARHVVPIYVEATTDETETRLLRGLRKRCSTLSNNQDLKETLAALRHGQGIPPGMKVLIVLDQFEQWLHGKRRERHTELVQALRQCDGARVQCVVMVRDDFWMAATRFLRELEIQLLEGQNSAAVDLFDVQHAEKVLRAFGRAFRVLPERRSETTNDQNHFVEQAVRGLAQDDKIVCVRLALFADMMKGKPWTPAKLKEVGGTEGIGVTFLEETFAATTAAPDHRYHHQAARGVLKALLPQQGTDIKGHMRSRQELLESSGYGDRQKDFDDLIRILDGEVRLITPTDLEAIDSDSPSTSVQTGYQYYQLTHDYLVPSLREWLTRKQTETRRGRTELRLDDRAALWKVKRENRHLPSLWEFLNIVLLTGKRNWTEPQQKMMRKAVRFHGIRSGVAAAAAIVALFTAWYIHGRFQGAALVKRLLAADISEVPGIVQELSAYRRWAEPLLWEQHAQAARGSDKKLHLDLALLPVDQSKIVDLREDLLVASPGAFAVVRDALSPYEGRVVKPLWDVALDPQSDVQKRFQAACALATYAPDDKHWGMVNTLVAARLVSLEASTLVVWREILRPARAQLIGPLASIYRDTNQKEQARIYATETLADYAADRPDDLFDLLADAELFQFPELFGKLTAHKEQAVARAQKELAKRPPKNAADWQKEDLATRQANAAVALLRLGSSDEVWPTLKFTPDPRARSDIIHWLGPLGVDPQPIIQRLDSEPDVTIRRALVLSLGGFTESQLSIAERQPICHKLLAIYENEPDAGLHGAAEWLLRKWGQAKRMDEVVETLKGDEKRLQNRRSSDKRRWYINTQKQTFVIIDAGEFLMGSPPSEPEASTVADVHHRRIGRRFAISGHELTKAQFRVFSQTSKGASLATHPELREIVRNDESPQTPITWYEAAHYCDWLSEQENIPRDQWCYDPKGGTYGPGMKAKEKFWELTGYRLPTEAEWEFACRGGTVTSRYYGLSGRLLPQYAWYLANGEDHTWPTATLKPNDLGLFDMLGNAGEWCFDLARRYPNQKDKVFEDTPATQPVAAADRRVMRGGDFVTRLSLVHSYNRFNNAPDYRGFDAGFRPARTYP
jgi:serine/threonine protein kinase/formylglycine-generating enzyme required for sulfatase activity